MITQNGLNLFKMMLTNTCLAPSEFTNIDNDTDYVTSLGATRTVWNNINDYYNGSVGTIESGTFIAVSSTFMPYTKNRTAQFNQTSLYNSSILTVNVWKTTRTMNNAPYNPNYLAEEVSIVTIPVGGELDKSTRLAQFNTNGVLFANPYCNSTGITGTSLEFWQPLAIYGTPPNDTEYLSITLPKCFHTEAGAVSLYEIFGAQNCSIWSNLGYSKDTESIDNYDLSSPVYNKKLNPIEMAVRCLEGKLEFVISFKNFESESISVNEFGLYTSSQGYADGQPIDSKNKVSLSRYKFGKGSTYYYDSSITEYDEVYVVRGIRTNLIARKVLPQTVTIPPDGIATFKYTIDLSEMKAQENITYSEE